MSPSRDRHEPDKPQPEPKLELPADRGGMGAVFVALGSIGTVLFAIALIGLLIATPSVLAAGDASASLHDGRQVVVDAASSIRSVDRSLAATQASSEDAATSLDSFAAMLRSTANASAGIDVFGQKPFAGLAQLFNSTADLATTTARDLRTTSDSIQGSRNSIQPLAGDLDRLGARLDTLRGGSAALLSPIVWWLLVGVCAWLLVVALALARFGWLLRHGRPTQPV